MNPIYEPSSFGHTLIALVFYLIMVGFALYSLIAIYALLRFGRSRILGLAVSILYLVICSSLYTTAVINLNKIKF